MANTSIKNWAEDDRPREKMMMKGLEALSNAEIIAILINNGTKDKSAVDVAKSLLFSVNNDLRKLSRMSVKDIVKLKIKGIGLAKAISIATAFELSRRKDATENRRDVVQHSRDIAEYIRSKLQHKKNEVFAVVFLNMANKINHFEVISEGGISNTIADPRIILKKALEHDAVSIILSHNHPSGSIKPSKADEMITQKLKEASKFIDIKVLDHIIVSEEGYYSFADEGLL